MRLNPVKRWSTVLSGVFLFALGLTSGAQAAPAAEGPVPIPTLAETLKLALKKNTRGSANEIRFQVKKFYYEIQSKSEQMDIAEEVKEHFDKAVEKSEEKFDSGEDENLSQSDITKLKLGRSGTLNDMIDLRNEIHVAILSLAHLTGKAYSYESPLEEESIKAVSFPYDSLKDYLDENATAAKTAEKKPAVKSGKNRRGIDRQKMFLLRKAFLEVMKARAKVKLAKKSRKITRALLVTEVANYDFGIGDSEELFQALIIYTRVLRGYYQTLYDFNVAVADLEKRKNQAIAFSK